MLRIISYFSKILSNIVISFQKGVFIVEVFPDGAAGKDGRLQSGDQILDMCKQNFKDMEHDKAHASVLQASGTVRVDLFGAENFNVIHRINICAHSFIWFIVQIKILVSIQSAVWTR